MNTLTFNGILSSDYGIYVIGNNDAEVPEFDYESVDIPGMTRAFHQSNKRLKNKLVVYHCFCTQNSAEMVPRFCSAMLSANIYQKITDTIHPEYYKMGTYFGGTQPQFRNSKDVATFDLIFDCDPRKFLVGGDTFQTVTIGQDFELTNARLGLFYNPVLRVNGISSVAVYRQITQSSSSTYFILVLYDDAPELYFDTETKYAYYGSNSRDQYVNSFYMGDPVIQRPGSDYKVFLRFNARSGASNPSASVALREYIL